MNKRTLASAGTDAEKIRVDVAIDDVNTGHQQIAVTPHAAFIEKPGETAIVIVLVVEPEKDRMHQVPVDAEGTYLQETVGAEPDRRLIGEAH